MVESSDDVDKAVTFLVQSALSTSPKKKAAQPIQLNVASLEKYSREHGLTGKQISTLVNAVASNSFSGRISQRIVRALLPATTVPETAVVRAMSYMCTNKPTTTTQMVLIRWILLVFDVLESNEQLHALYGVIFYFLENEAMCPYVCHLLYLLTRRSDVRLYRVKAVLNLQKRMGSQHYIMGLLSVYKAYCPELMALTLPRIPKSFFKPAERVWAANFKKVQAKQQDVDRSSNVWQNSLLEVRSKVRDVDHLVPASKRRRLEVIPPVLTCSRVTSHSRGHQRRGRVKVPIKLISSFGELLKNLDNVELPSQMASALMNSNLQHVISLHSDAITALRIGYWMHHTLDEEFFRHSGEKAQGRQAVLLESLVLFADFLKEGMPVVEDFLARYLHVWNGVNHRPLVFKLISRIRLMQYGALNDLILEPLRKLFFVSSVYFKCEVIECLTAMLINYAGVEWPRYKYTIMLQRDKANIAQSYVETPNFYTSFPQEVEVFNGPETVAGLARFVDSLCSIALPLEKDNALLTYCVTDFCFALTSLHQQYKFPMVLLPNRAIIYRLLMSTNPVSLSRVAAAVARYRVAFVDLRNVTFEGQTDEQQLCTMSRGQVHKYNTHLLDFSDTLWRNRSFDIRDNYTIFKLVDDEMLKQVDVENKKDAFSVSRHPALFGLVWKFLKETQPKGKQVHPADIRQCQDKLLDYLERESVYGVSQFIRATIRRCKRSLSK